MANVKNELLSKEKNKERKKYLKSETFMLMLAIILIGIGAGLGIYYGINANHSEINKTNLSNFNKAAIIGSENMSVDDAFNAFLDNNKNKNLTDLRDNVDLTFIKPSYITAGSLTIIAKADTKYTGSITITINAITQTNLSELNLKQTLTQPYTEQTEAFQAFINLNSQVSDLETNVKIDSFNRPNYGQDGSLIINGINKYTGILTITINGIIPTDQDIVDAVINSSIVFDAVKSVNETLQHFINSVLRGQGNPYNPDNDPLWYIKGQLRNHINSYPILRFADVNKYQFIKFCLKDSNHTPLTDDYLNANSRAGETIIFQINFNYGEVQNQYIDFVLSFKQE